MEMVPRALWRQSDFCISFLFFWSRGPGRGRLSKPPLVEGVSLRGKKQILYKRAAPLLQKICFHQIDGWERSERLTLFTSFFLFRPLSAVSPVVSPNSSSCTIPTTGEVAIQTTSDGAEERAIVSEGLTLLLSIDWKGEKGKITSIDYRTGQGGLARTYGGVRKYDILRPTSVRTTTDTLGALSPFYCPHFTSLLDFRQ